MEWNKAVEHYNVCSGQKRCPDPPGSESVRWVGLQCLSLVRLPLQRTLSLKRPVNCRVRVGVEHTTMRQRMQQGLSGKVQAQTRKGRRRTSKAEMKNSNQDIFDQASLV